MTRIAMICMSLAGLPAVVWAQPAPDLFSLVFSPAPTAHESRPERASPGEARRPEERSNPDASLERLVQSVEALAASIGAEESLSGTRARTLIGPLTSLAAAYDELGEHAPAMAALERAAQISRMHDGLHSLNQAAIVDQMIDTLDAAAQFGASDALQESLVELAGRNEDDPRALSVLAGVAERQMRAVDAYLEQSAWPRGRTPHDAIDGSGWEPAEREVGRHKAGPRLGQIGNGVEAAIEEALGGDGAAGELLPPEADLAEIYALIDTANDCVEVGRYRASYRCSVHDPETDATGARFPEVTDRELALAALRRARRLYHAAMQMALAHGGHAEYAALEAGLVDTHYYERAHPDLHPAPCYVRCSHPRHPERIDTLQSVLQARTVARLTQGAPPIEVARAVVELGDLYSNSSALEWYQRAHDFLVRRDVPRETIAALFSPDVPALRPALPPPDLAAFDAARRYRGHIDVEIRIGRYGESKDVDIVAASPGTPESIEKRLRTHVLQSRFRPRFVDGRPAASDRFSRRYYYDY